MAHTEQQWVDSAFTLSNHATPWNGSEVSTLPNDTTIPTATRNKIQSLQSFASYFKVAGDADNYYLLLPQMVFEPTRDPNNFAARKSKGVLLKIPKEHFPTNCRQMSAPTGKSWYNVPARADYIKDYYGMFEPARYADTWQVRVCSRSMRSGSSYIGPNARVHLSLYVEKVDETTGTYVCSLLIRNPQISDDLAAYYHPEPILVTGKRVSVPTKISGDDLYEHLSIRWLPPTTYMSTDTVASYTEAMNQTDRGALISRIYAPSYLTPLLGIDDRLFIRDIPYISQEDTQRPEGRVVCTVYPQDIMHGDTGDGNSPFSWHFSGTSDAGYHEETFILLNRIARSCLPLMPNTVIWLAMPLMVRDGSHVKVWYFKYSTGDGLTLTRSPFPYPGGANIDAFVVQYVSQTTLRRLTENGQEEAPGITWANDNVLQTNMFNQMDNVGEVSAGYGLREGLYDQQTRCGYIDEGTHYQYIVAQDAFSMTPANAGEVYAGVSHDYGLTGIKIKKNINADPRGGHQVRTLGYMRYPSIVTPGADGRVNGHEVFPVVPDGCLQIMNYGGDVRALYGLSRSTSDDIAKQDIAYGGTALEDVFVENDDVDSPWVNNVVGSSYYGYPIPGFSCLYDTRIPMDHNVPGNINTALQQPDTLGQMLSLDKTLYHPLRYQVYPGIPAGLRNVLQVGGRKGIAFHITPGGEDVAYIFFSLRTGPNLGDLYADHRISVDIYKIINGVPQLIPSARTHLYQGGSLGQVLDTDLFVLQIRNENGQIRETLFKGNVTNWINNPVGSIYGPTGSDSWGDMVVSITYEPQPTLTSGVYDHPSHMAMGGLYGHIGPIGEPLEDGYYTTDVHLQELGEGGGYVMKLPESIFMKLGYAGKKQFYVSFNTTIGAALNELEGVNILYGTSFPNLFPNEFEHALFLLIKPSGALLARYYYNFTNHAPQTIDYQVTKIPAPDENYLMPVLQPGIVWTTQGLPIPCTKLPIDSLPTNGIYVYDKAYRYTVGNTIRLQIPTKTFTGSNGATESAWVDVSSVPGISSMQQVAIFPDTDTQFITTPPGAEAGLLLVTFASGVSGVAVLHSANADETDWIEGESVDIYHALPDTTTPNGDYPSCASSVFTTPKMLTPQMMGDPQQLAGRHYVGYYSQGDKASLLIGGGWDSLSSSDDTVKEVLLNFENTPLMEAVYSGSPVVVIPKEVTPPVVSTTTLAEGKSVLFLNLSDPNNQLVTYYENRGGVLIESSKVILLSGTSQSVSGSYSLAYPMSYRTSLQMVTGAYRAVFSDTDTGIADATFSGTDDVYIDAVSGEATISIATVHCRYHPGVEYLATNSRLVFSAQIDLPAPEDLGDRVCITHTPPNANDYAYGNVVIYLPTDFRDSARISYHDGSGLVSADLTWIRGDIDYRAPRLGQISDIDRVGCDSLNPNTVYMGRRRIVQVTPAPLNIDTSYRSIRVEESIDTGEITFEVAACWASNDIRETGTKRYTYQLPGKWRLLTHGISQILIDPRADAVDRYDNFQGYPDPGMSMEIALLRSPDDTLVLALQETTTTQRYFLLLSPSVSDGVSGDRLFTSIATPVDHLVFPAPTINGGICRIEQLPADEINGSLAGGPGDIHYSIDEDDVLIRLTRSIIRSSGHGGRVTGVIRLAGKAPTLTDALRTEDHVCITHAILADDLGNSHGVSDDITTGWPIHHPGQILIGRSAPTSVSVYLSDTDTWTRLGTYALYPKATLLDVSANTYNYVSCSDHYGGEECTREFMPVLPPGDALTTSWTSDTQNVNFSGDNIVLHSGMTNIHHPSVVSTSYTHDREYLKGFMVSFTRSPLGPRGFDTSVSPEGPGRFILYVSQTPLVLPNQGLPDIPEAGIAIVLPTEGDLRDPSVVMSDGIVLDLHVSGDMSTYLQSTPGVISGGVHQIDIAVVDNNGYMAVYIYEDGVLKMRTQDQATYRYFHTLNNVSGYLSLLYSSIHEDASSETIGELQVRELGVSYQCVPEDLRPYRRGCEKAPGAISRVWVDATVANTLIRLYSPQAGSRLAYIHLDISRDADNNAPQQVEVYLSDKEMPTARDRVFRYDDITDADKVKRHSLRVMAGETLWMRGNVDGIPVRVSAIEELLTE
jgi:hypothetical protein